MWRAMFGDEMSFETRVSAIFNCTHHVQFSKIIWLNGITFCVCSTNKTEGHWKCTVINTNGVASARKNLNLFWNENKPNNVIW